MISDAAEKHPPEDRPAADPRGAGRALRGGTKHSRAVQPAPAEPRAVTRDEEDEDEIIARALAEDQRPSFVARWLRLPKGRLRTTHYLVLGAGLLAAAAIYLISPWLFGGGSLPPMRTVPSRPAPAPPPPPAARQVDALVVAVDSSPAVRLGIAYGTEKELWLQWAAREFQKQPAGRDITFDLIPMGSLEGAYAVLKGDQRIHVWSPASSMYRQVFVDQWKLHSNDPPIVKEQNLALTPLVFVMWKKRYDAFRERFGTLSFRTVAEALEIEGGWGGIAGKPEWGLFKFGHTHPNQSNSGLMTLALMAYDFHDKSRRLTPADIVDPRFQNWMTRLERGVSGLSNSTGNMMKEMILKGPSSFDALMLYESVAIERVRSAEGRWDELRVIYPRYNLWCDNPYYILATPWVTPRHQQAAATFLEFLLSEPVQQKALEHGFRPGNPDVPVRFPESPLVKFARYGFDADVSAMCETPTPEALDNLLQSWLRAAEIR